MKIAYIAFDGKEFESKEECIEYESKVNYGVLFFDSLTNLIDFNQANFGTTARFIFIPSVQALVFFKQKIEEWSKEGIPPFCNSYNFYAPGFYICSTGNHFYHYNKDDIDKVENLDSIIKGE